MRTFIKSWKRIFIANVVALFFAAVSFAAISLSEASSPYIMWQGRNNHLLIEVTFNGSKLTPTEMAAITKAEVNFNGQIVDSTICAGCFDWTTYAAQSKVLVNLGAANFDLTTTDRDKDTIFLLYSSSWTYGLVGGTFYMKVKDEADSGGDIIEPLSVITIVVTSPTSGQALIYDGTNWVNGDVSSFTTADEIDPTVNLTRLQSLTSNDFHNLGGTDQVDDADNDPANEIQAGDGVTITGVGTTLDPFIAVGDGTGTDDQTATEVPYTNTTSLLTAINAQAAIDEIEARVDTNDGKVSFAWDYDYADLINTPTIPSGNQIIDWTQDQGVVDIHSGNYTDTNTTYTAGTGMTLDGTVFNCTITDTDDQAASEVPVTTTNFDGIFANGITSDTVQECLNLVDDHNHSGIYEPAGITASDISDKNAGTDITADLEEETHAPEHAVGAADTVFPADPNADKYLMWDDVPGELIWATAGAAPPDADYGDVTVSGGVWAVEDDSHAHTTTTISGLDIGDDTNLAGTANEITLTGDMLSLSAVIDLGGKTSLEVPNAADPTTDASGEIAVDSSAAPGSGIRFYGDAAYTLAGTYSKSFVILNPVATDDYPVWCTPYAITIKRVRVQCLGGTNIVGQLTECDGEGINAAVVDSSDITAAANNSVDDDGMLSNPSIDANDFIGWKTESISGTPTSITVTFDYTINNVN